MTEPICEDEGILQEWAPEYRLLSQIPLKAQRGIFSQDLKLTCVDVCPEYICLGTNCGLVYWYCRRSAELQRLRLENTNCSVTCVKIVSTVEYMIASGTDAGNVTVFQIPKQPPESLPEALKPRQKQVERFTINGLHRTYVTCLEWSPNGMKLFSGDKSGMVVLTSIDFQMHLSKSSELLNEQFEVVQLSYMQSQLLVSTSYRTVVCDGNNEWRVSQIGSKDRKILGKFGATFCKFRHGAVIYASRPGHRLWLADLSGSVQQTLIFKAAVQAPHPRIPILNPTSRLLSSDQHFGKLIQFGENRLVSYQTEVLHILHPGAIAVVASLLDARKIIDVAINGDEIFVLEGDRSLIRISHEPNLLAIDDPVETSEKRKSFNLEEIASKIKETAVGSLKRMASDLMREEKLSSPTIADEAIDLPPLQSPEENENFLPEPNVEIHESVDEPTVKNTEISSSAGLPKPAVLEEEVLFRPGKRRKPKKPEINQFLQSGQESESDSVSVTSGERLVCGFANGLSTSEDSPTWSQSQSASSFSMLRDFQTLPLSQSEPGRTPDDKSQASLDTCDSASENLVITPNIFKEEQEKTFKRLANQEISMLDSYNSEMTENMSISVNLTPSSSASSKLSERSEVSENVSMISECEPHELPSNKENELWPSNETSSVSSGQSQAASRSAATPTRIWNKELILSQMLGLNLDDPLNRRQTEEQEQIKHCDSHDPKPLDECPTLLEDTSCAETSLEINSKDDKFENVEESNSLLPESDQDLTWANLTENTTKVTTDQKLSSMDGLSYGPPSGSSMLSSCHPSLDINSGPAALSNPQALVVEKSDRWLQYKTPEGINSLAVCNNYVMCTDDNNQVFYSPLADISLKWAALDYRASAASVSLDSRIVWLQGSKYISALIEPSATGPFSDEAVEAARNVISFCVDSDCAYYVKTDGKLCCQRGLDRYPCGKKEDVPCQWLLKKVWCRNGKVLALTTDDILISKKPDGLFTIVSTPTPSINYAAIGPLDLVWVIDSESNIYFSNNIDSENPTWWQVLISEYIFQNRPSTFLSMHNCVKMGAKWDMGRYCGQSKPTMIATNDFSVWVFKKHSSFVQVNKLDFSGVIWRDISFRARLKLSTICVNGVFEEKGHIWMVSVQSDLFVSSPDTPNNILSVASPCGSGISCVAAAPETLWVLTADGTVHARLGLSQNCLTGSGWRQLRLPQLTDQQLVWVSCGCDVAWSVDVTGRVFISLVPPHDMATNIFDAAWLEVEGKPKDGALFVKVFVGLHMHMVWALDSNRQIYVREGIFANYQIGTGWVHVGGVEASNLAVSGTAVWCVSPEGAIFRRHGISENNYIGDYWRRVPGMLSSASATFSDEVWGIKLDGSVTRMLQRSVTSTKNEERSTVLVGEADDWLVVE